MNRQLFENGQRFRRRIKTVIKSPGQGAGKMIQNRNSAWEDSTEVLMHPTFKGRKVKGLEKFGAHRKKKKKVSQTNEKQGSEKCKADVF